MVAIGLLVDPLRKKLPALELLEQLAAPAREAHELVAKDSGRSPEHARAHQEVLQFGRKAGQGVAAEILAHQRRSADQAGEDASTLGLRLSDGRQEEQLQVGRPPAGPAGEGRDVLGEKRISVHVAEQLLHLPRAEPEIFGTHLNEPPRHSEADEVQAQVHPRRQDQAHPARHFDHQLRQRRLGLGAFNQVHVIHDHEHGRSATAQRFVERVDVLDGRDPDGIGKRSSRRRDERGS